MNMLSVKQKELMVYNLFSKCFQRIGTEQNYKLDRMRSTLLHNFLQPIILFIYLFVIIFL